MLVIEAPFYVFMAEQERDLTEKNMEETPVNEGAGDKLVDERMLYSDVEEFFTASDEYVRQERREAFDENEKMLLGTLDDDLSTSTAKSRVYDPRLSTVVIERSARVMAQAPTGHSYALAKDDIGKSKLMDMMLQKYVYRNANAQLPFLTKLRLWDLYSLVYGVQFALLDWRADGGYVGPDIWLLPIRDCFPQPGAISVQECDRFQVSTLRTKQYLEGKKDAEGWQHIPDLINVIKEGGVKEDDKSSDRRSAVSEQRHPSVQQDNVFPQAELRTEYRKDRWITYSPQLPGKILRDIPNPHGNNKLPIYAKYCFPLMDNIYGLGEFERGKTLQYAINSLINLYMDGVKMSIFPPMQINPDGVVPSTIKIGPAEKWLVNRPNIDIQETRISPQGLNTFQSTYSFLTSALMNQAGTTDVSTPKQADATMGKTPQAIKYLEKREGSRDVWDRAMMDRALEQLGQGMVDLITEKMETPITLRLFGSEIEEIAESYPDVTEIFESGESGQMDVTKDLLASKYDYVIDSGSTYKHDPQEEARQIGNVLGFVMSNPAILEIMPKQAQMLGEEPKTVSISELFKRFLITGGLKDWDRILQSVNVPEQGQAPGQSSAQSQAQIDPNEFKDPRVKAMAQQLQQAMGGMGNVPTQR